MPKEEPKKSLQNAADDADLAIAIKTSPPQAADLFRLENEADLFKGIRREVQKSLGSGKDPFPSPGPIRPAMLRQERIWDTNIKNVEPNYVCYRRLYFEQRNFERYGYGMGPLQPMISASIFYADVLRWPLDYFSAPWRRYDCSAGLCLPGDPVPFIWCPPLHK